jgi:hypothetical protein
MTPKQRQKYMISRRAKLRRTGLCITCEHGPTDGRHQNCAACRASARVRYRSRQIARIENCAREISRLPMPRGFGGLFSSRMPR